MRYIDYGVALLESRALALAPDQLAFDVADLYSRLVGEGKMLGHEVTQRFYEIGTPEGLEQTRSYLLSHESPRISSHTAEYLSDAARILGQLDQGAIERIAQLLVALRERGGRLFFLGVGGSAANASHAVNDFRKIAQIESYAPTDNVAELTARTNDEGWDTSFAAWLQLSRLSDRDMIFVLSVGGGDLVRNVSPNIVRALQFAQSVGAKICGVVGRDGGYTAEVADAVVIVPTVNPRTVTPHAEAFQAVIWHLLVSDPRLQAAETKWESTR
jgi:D-sedoheptulose 7-phosphate isomerase